MRRMLWILGGCLLAVVPFGAAYMSRPGVLREDAVHFATAGGQTLLLDLARPAEGKGPFPAVVCLHGGGWTSGDRKQMAQTLEVLARRGYVAIAPDYRLAPAHPFPAAVEDAKAAVRWLRASAGQYHIDRDRVGIVGLSAGGHLACLVGLTEPEDGLEGTGGHGEQSSRVQAVVSLSGPTDLTAAVWKPEALEKNLKPFLGGSPTERPDVARKASPLYYPVRRPPAMLLVHGAADTAVPSEQVEALARKVTDAGGSARVELLSEAGHGFAGKHLLVAVDRMLTFLDGTLKR